ncbi:MAG: HlyD family type I secretion periplasmic adaptor subunit [Pseudomonadales bacterium]
MNKMFNAIKSTLMSASAQGVAFRNWLDGFVAVAAEIPANHDYRRYTRLGWSIVLGGFGSFVLWAGVAPLDQGVPMAGTVTVESSSKPIAHGTGGTVEEILVREGQRVRAGDVLIRMNAVQATADADTTRVQLYTARAMAVRLEAERAGLETVVMPPELADVATDPRLKEAWRVQEQLFNTRRAAQFNELGSLKENIAGLRAQSRGIAEALDGKRRQLAFKTEQLESLRTLSTDGYVARNRLLDLEQQHAEVSAGIATDEGSLGRVERQIAEFTLTLKQREEAFQEQVRTQLAEAQTQAEALQSRLLGLDHDLANEDLRAPVDGIVMNLSVYAPGAVVGAGSRLMDIVPSEDALVVEGRLPVHLVDNIRLGLPVELMLSAFNQNTTPHVPGEVVRVSADRVVDERTGEPFFKVLVRTTDEGMAMLQDYEVVAGMPVDLFVKTGERTMASYLMKPIADHLKLSMSEE